jgi:hypothetical protein
MRAGRRAEPNWLVRDNRDCMTHRRAPQDPLTPTGTGAAPSWTRRLTRTRRNRGRCADLLAACCCGAQYAFPLDGVCPAQAPVAPGSRGHRWPTQAAVVLAHRRHGQLVEGLTAPISTPVCALDEAMAPPQSRGGHLRELTPRHSRVDGVLRRCRRTGNHALGRLRSEHERSAAVTDGPPAGHHTPGRWRDITAAPASQSAGHRPG